MRKNYLMMSTLLLLAFLLAACAGQATPNVEGAVNTAAVPASTLAASTAVETAVGAVSTLVASTEVQNAAVEDFNGLVTALQAAGVTVESSADVTQPFFTVQGKTLKINGQDVQVFVYDNGPAMEAEASQIAADASTIGTNMPTWMSDPHFYKLGRMLVLYVGQDQKVLDILTGILGPQFAGK